MTTDFEAFFRSYTECYNRSLGDTPDIDGIRANFTDCFIAAGPDGVGCGRNDASFVDTLKKGYAFYKSIGTQRMNVRHVDVTVIDDNHHMAKVFYRADYEKKNGEPLSLDFDVTYMLETVADRTRIFAFVAGDEMGLYRKHGLIPG